jgi:hypothetical protein
MLNKLLLPYKSIFMKKLILMFVFMAGCAVISAQDYQDVVYLKDGNVVRGIITEQFPGKSLKIETAGGSVFVFQITDIEHISTEEAAVTKTPASNADTIRVAGNQYFYRGEAVNSKAELRNIIASNPEALRLFKSTRTPAVIANIFGFTGGLLTGFAAAGYIAGGDPPLWILAAGLGCMAIAMPISIAQNVKLKKAVQIYNGGLHTGYSPQKTQLFFSMSNNGIGLTLKF